MCLYLVNPENKIVYPFQEEEIKHISIQNDYIFVYTKDLIEYNFPLWPNKEVLIRFLGINVANLLGVKNNE